MNASIGDVLRYLANNAIDWGGVWVSVLVWGVALGWVRGRSWRVSAALWARLLLGAPPEEDGG